LSRLRDHLDSPQFTDERGETTGETAFRFGGNWVKSGVPRWKAYLFYGISFFGGIGLVLTRGPDGFDLLAYGGIAFIAIGVGGTIEIVRGRPFPKIF